MPDSSIVDTKSLPLSLVDDLTQLCNRRFIYQNMPQIISQNKAFSIKSCLFMIDVDNFKRINDTFGHMAGDQLLIKLTEVMKRSVAEKGVVARYAGDEFIVLLPGQDEGQAGELSQNLLQNASSFKWSAKDKDFTGHGISIGLAVYPEDGALLPDLINSADQALYAAKKSGKNKMVTYKAVGKEIKSRTMLGHMLLRPPLIGRKEELEGLKGRYGKVLEGAKKEAALVDGEPGIGKTRLLEELAGWSKKQGTFFIFAKLDQKEDGGPLSALATLLRIVVNSVDSDKFRDTLTRLTPPELSEILYLYPAAKKLLKGASPKAEPKGRADNLFSGLRKILADAALGKAFILAVDNLHYANQLTLQFFSTLLDSSDVTKSLFIGAYSKESTDEALKNFLAKDIFTTIKLKPFTPDEAARLIASIFPDVKFEPGLIDNIFKISRGNPLSICGILKAMVENGQIRYEGDGWKLTDIDVKDIPGSLSEAMKPVLGNLDSETKEMLSTAAVMGEKIDVDMLKKLGGYNEGHLMELLDRASKAGLIGSADPSNDSLSFRAGPAREALAGMVPREKAESIHKKLTELIERNHQGDLSVQLDRLIHHLELAKGKESSLKYRNLSQKLSEEFILPERPKGIPVKEEEEEEDLAEFLEKPLSDASSKYIKDLMLAIRAAAIGTLLYPAGNNMRVELENRAYDIMLKIFKNDNILTISNVSGKVLINGSAPKHLDLKGTMGFTLVNMMEDYWISSISFRRGLRKDEFAEFLRYFADPEAEELQEGGLAGLLKDKGVSHIKVGQLKYNKQSDSAKNAAGGAKGDGPAIAEAPKDSLLDMAIDKYVDPKIAGKMGLITEALILNKNDEKVKSIVEKFSKELKSADASDKSALVEGAVRLSESLLAYEKMDLLKTMIKSLSDRFNAAQQSKELARICEGLQGMASNLIDRKDFSQAGAIVKEFREQASPDSPRTEAQKKIVDEGLQKIAHPKVVETLITAFKEKLRTGNYADVSDLLIGLGGHAVNAILNLLTQEELEEKEPFELYVMRHSLAMILKKIGQPAKDALKKMLSDKRSYVVKNVIEIFGYIGGGEFIPLVAPFMRAPSAPVRMQCVVTLKKIGTAESLKVLAGGLKDHDEDVRQAASLAIAELADGSFIKELGPFLNDESTKGIAKSTIQKIEAKKKK